MSGDIELLSDLVVADDAFTVNAFTAPNGGVQLKGYPVYINAGNGEISHLKFRAGNYSGINVRSCLTLWRGANNLHIHHCDFQWAPYDDLVVIYEEVGYPAIHDILLEYCVLAEGLHDTVNTGKCIEIGRSDTSASCYNIVVRRNLLLTCRDRMPLITGNGYSQPALGVCFDNNLVANWIRGGEVRWYVDASFRYNILKDGQNTYAFGTPSGQLKFDPQTQQYVDQSSLYHAGNEHWSDDELTKVAAMIATNASGFYYNYAANPTGYPSWYARPQILSCDAAYAKIIAEAGAWAGGARDSLTLRCISDAQGTGGPLVESVTDVDYPDLTV